MHPTNATFNLGGEVGSALSKEGGDDFVKAVQALHKDHGDLEMSGGMSYHGFCMKMWAILALELDSYKH